MKLDLFGPDGTARGEVEVPDNVVHAANVVGNFLRAQPQGREGLIAVAGVALYSPLYQITHKPPAMGMRLVEDGDKITAEMEEINPAETAARLECRLARICAYDCTTECKAPKSAQANFWWKKEDQ